MPCTRRGTGYICGTWWRQLVIYGCAPQRNCLYRSTRVGCRAALPVAAMTCRRAPQRNRLLFLFLSMSTTLTLHEMTVPQKIDSYLGYDAPTLADMFWVQSSMLAAMNELTVSTNPTGITPVSLSPDFMGVVDLVRVSVDADRSVPSGGRMSALDMLTSTMSVYNDGVVPPMKSMDNGIDHATALDMLFSECVSTATPTSVFPAMSDFTDTEDEVPMLEDIKTEACTDEAGLSTMMSDEEIMAVCATLTADSLLTLKAVVCAIDDGGEDEAVEKLTVASIAAVVAVAEPSMTTTMMTVVVTGPPKTLAAPAQRRGKRQLMSGGSIGKRGSVSRTNENVDGGDDGGAYDAVEPGRRMAALSMLSEMFDGYRNVTVDSVSDALNLAAIIDASVVKSGGLLPMKKAVAAAAALPTIDELVVEHLGDSGDDTACATSVVVPSYALLPTTAVVDCCPMSVDDVSVAAAFGGDDTGAFSLADYGFDSLFDVGGDKAAYDALSGQIGLLGDDSMTAYLDCSALVDVADVAFVTDAALAVTDVAAFVVTETAVVSEIAAVDESEAVIVAEIESETAVVSEIAAVVSETVAVSETIVVTVIPAAYDVTETSAVVAVVAVAAPRPNKGGSGGGGKRAHVRCNRDETCDETDETDAPNQCSICCGTSAPLVTYHPCGHDDVCATCTAKVNTCPSCRSRIDTTTP